MAGIDAVQAKRLKFREILSRKKITVMPGGFSPVYAKLAQLANFECFFLAGSQLSAYLYGLPDNGLIGLRDVVDHARHMAARCDIPIFIDTDTGFGNAVNVYYTVQECIRAGVAGLQIEDQEAPKKSGTLAGRRCISIEEAVGKYRAAVAARDELDPTFVICARCDVLGAEGGSFEDALDRCIAYVKEGGVDFVWLNSIETREQVQEACAKIPAPVLGIWAGHEESPSISEFESLGLKIVLYPTMTANAGLEAAWRLLNDLHTRGNKALIDWADAADKNPWGRVDRRALLNTGKIQELEKLFLTETTQRNYEDTWGHLSAFSKDSPLPANRKPRL